MKVNLRDLTLPEMVTFINSIGEPKYRAKQVFGWIYKGKTKLYPVLWTL